MYPLHRPAILQTFHAFAETHSLPLMQAKLEHANHILAEILDAPESAAVESDAVSQNASWQQHNVTVYPLRCPASSQTFYAFAEIPSLQLVQAKLEHVSCFC